MSRGIGELAAIQDSIPDWLAVVIELLTQLGDVWFLAVLLSILYWTRPTRQDAIAAVAGIWLAGMGLYKGLKEVFGLPRPEEALLDASVLPWFIEPVYELTAFATGYGFPSGHAVNSTIVYVGLALVLGVATKRIRLLVATGIVLIVSFTRLALGVHFLVDVIVGAGIGLVLIYVGLAYLQRQTRDAVTLIFGLSVICATFFLLTSKIHPDALFLTGVTLGAFAGWQMIVLARQLSVLQRPSKVFRPVVIRGGLALLAIAPLVAALELFPILTTFGASGIVGLSTVAIVIIPVMRYSPMVRRFGVGVRFWVKIASNVILRVVRRILKIIRR